MRISEIIRLTVICYSLFASIHDLNGQAYSTTGNGHEFELKVGNTALDCIMRKCYEGLEESGFIDSTTVYNKDNINSHLDSLYLKWKYLPRNRKYSRNIAIPPRTVVRTFYRNSDSIIYFQIQLDLGYSMGFIKVQEIKIHTDSFVYTEMEELEKVKIDNDNGRLNVPLPPPPPSVESTYRSFSSQSFCHVFCDGPFFWKDRTGNTWLTERIRYRSLKQINGNRLLAHKGEDYGIIDYENNIIVPLMYDSVIVRASQNYIVSNAGKMGVIDKDGDNILPTIYDSINERGMLRSNTVNIIYIVENDGLFGVFDKKGKVLLPFAYEEIELVNSGFLKVKRNGLYGILGRNLEEMVPIEYEDLFYPNTRFIVVKKEKLFGLLLNSGKVLREPRYLEIRFERTNNFDYHLIHMKNRRGKTRTYLYSFKSHRIELIKI